MAGDKYKIEWSTPISDCRLRIQKEGFGGSVTDLTPARNPFLLKWDRKNRPDLTLPLKVSTAKIRIIGDADGGLLEEVFDGGDTEWPVIFERNTTGSYQTEWQGFLATDLWRDNPNTDSEVIELEAIDGLALLEDRDLNLTQTQDLYTICRNTLRGLHPLDVAATMEWYPYRQGNQLNADELPLAKLLVDEKAFDELEPIEGGSGFETTARRNQRRGLEAILERFGMELFQTRGEWRIRQRCRIRSDGTVNVWTDKDAVDNNNRSTRDLNRDLGNIGLADRPRSLVQRLRETQSVHTYDDLGELVRNGSFEGQGSGSLDGWTGNATVKNYDNTLLGGSATQEDTYVATFKGDKISQDVPAILHDAGPRSALGLEWDFVQSENSTPNQVWAETRIALDATWYVQARQLTVASDTDAASDGVIPLSSSLSGFEDTILIPQGAELPVHEFEGNPASTRITLTEPARAGDDTLQASIPVDLPSGAYIVYWFWSDTQQSETDSNGNTFSYWGLYFETTEYPGAIDGTTLHRQSLQVPMNAPDGTDLSGKDISFTVEMRTGARGWLDHVSAQLTIRGDPIDRTSYTALDDQSGREIRIKQLLGDGPTYEHPRALQLSGVEVTGDWKIGNYVYQEYPSGELLEQVTAEAAMRQQRDTLQRRTHTVLLKDQEVWPQDVFTIGGDQYTVSYLQRTFSMGAEDAEVELTRLKDAGISNLERTYQMDSEGNATPGSTGGTPARGGGAGGDGPTIVSLDASGGDVTEDLPGAGASDSAVAVRTDSTSTNTATITDPGGNTIYWAGRTNAASYDLKVQQAFFFSSDGSNWYVEGAPIYEIGSFAVGRVRSGDILLRHRAEHDIKTISMGIDCEVEDGNDPTTLNILTGSNGSFAQQAQRAINQSTKQQSFAVSTAVETNDVLKVVADENSGIEDISITFDVIRA
jgi:hypothetical protein